MSVVGAILSLQANKRSLIRAVVLIGSTSALQAEACASKLCLHIATAKGIRESKNRQYAGFFMPALGKFEQAAVN